MSEVKLRYSKQRETIYEMIKQDTSHPNVDTIYFKVKQIIPDISLGTVYRNLNLLTDQKRINRFDFGDGVIHFDAITTPHYHFICDKCKQVHDLFLDESLIIPLVNKVQTDYDVHIEETEILFHGTCQNCRNKKS